jgi:hypothetical protein
MKIMYNFGNINNAFSEILLESFIKKDASKKKAFQTYLKTIKESKILKTQYLIYKNISDKCGNNWDDIKTSEYIKENIQLMNNFNVNTIAEENKKLVSLIGDNINLLESDYKFKELNENIGTLIENNKNRNPNNIDKIVESFNFVLNHIKSNVEIEPEELVSENVCQLAIHKFNQKYSEMNEGDYNILKTIIKTNKEETFKTTVNECINLIDSKLDENDSEINTKLLKVKDKLSKLTYIEENFISDIIKITELKKYHN